MTLRIRGAGELYCERGMSIYGKLGAILTARVAAGTRLGSTQCTVPGTQLHSAKWMSIYGAGALGPTTDRPLPPPYDGRKMIVAAEGEFVRG